MSLMSVTSISEDDLYGDLESSVFKNGSQNPEHAAGLEERLQKMKKENALLKEENRRLQKKNKNYATNISSLYQTAKTEIDKKNFIIKQLQQKLEGLTSKMSGMSKSEVERLVRQCKSAQAEASAKLTIEEIEKALQQINDAPKTPPGYKKQYKFGNMSLYFFKEQVPFSRKQKVVMEEPVEENSVAVQSTQNIEKEKERTEKMKSSTRESRESSKDSQKSEKERTEKMKSSRESRESSRDSVEQTSVPAQSSQKSEKERTEKMKKSSRESRESSKDSVEQNSVPAQSSQKCEKERTEKRKSSRDSKEQPRQKHRK